MCGLAGGGRAAIVEYCEQEMSTEIANIITGEMRAESKHQKTLRPLSLEGYWISSLVRTIIT